MSSPCSNGRSGTQFTASESPSTSTTSGLPFKTVPWKLKDALCNPDVQREIIATGAAALHEISQRPRSPSLLGSRPEPKGTRQKNLTVAELMLTPEPAIDRCPKVAGYFQSVAACETDRIVLTWCTLAMMVLFPPCADQVASHTDVRWATYFSGSGATAGLRTRIVDAITGSNTAVAKTPLEVVLAEWQLYDRICK